MSWQFSFVQREEFVILFPCDVVSPEPTVWAFALPVTWALNSVQPKKSNLFLTNAYIHLVNVV